MANENMRGATDFERGMSLGALVVSVLHAVESYLNKTNPGEEICEEEFLSVDRFKGILANGLRTAELYPEQPISRLSLISALSEEQKVLLHWVKDQSFLKDAEKFVALVKHGYLMVAVLDMVLDHNAPDLMKIKELRFRLRTIARYIAIPLEARETSSRT